MAFTASSDIEDSINTSVFEQSSPESLRPRTVSPTAHEHPVSSSSGPTLHNDDEDDYFGSKGIKQCTSSRSSISSFPSSVIHTIQFTDNEDYGSRTPSRSQFLNNGRHSPAYKPPSSSYLAAFRHPSSVRALQLESEYADSDTYSVARPSRHGKSPKVSYFSPRSPGSTQSSPTKRSSRPGTPQQKKSSSKLKKEFPLVLLHCTLLPPATTTRGPSVSEEILEAVLPEEYRKSWRTLQDKVVKNNEVKQRGVLIAHPRDDYDLLEERLLEALELERPRIRKGHYIGTSKSDSDSGFESSGQNDTDEGSEVDEQDEAKCRDKCPDCGKAVSCKLEQDRRWEVKIFAANGLMRSGAWSAAWEQMEKIDVEVAVWMPEDVRFEVEERLKALQAKEEAEKLLAEHVDPPKKKRTRSNTAKLRHDERMREIYGEPEETQVSEEVNGHQETLQPESAKPPTEPAIEQKDADVHPEDILPEAIFAASQLPQHEVPPQTDFLTYMKHHFRIIINDQRNLAIVLLSIMVLFFSVQNLDSSSAPSVVPKGAIKADAKSPTATLEVPSTTADTASMSMIPSFNSEEISASSLASDMFEAAERSASTPLIEDHIASYDDLSTEQSTDEIPNKLDEVMWETGSDEIPEISSNQIHTHVEDMVKQPDLEQTTRDSPYQTLWPLSLFTYDTCELNEEQSYQSGQ